MNPPAYLWVILVFSSLAVVGFFLFGLSSALRRRGNAGNPALVRTAAGVLLGWLGLSIALAAAGAYEARPYRIFPYIALAINLPILIGGIAMWRSARLREIVNLIPPSWLIAFQAYRGQGGLFLLLSGLGLLPAAFAIPAGFGDVFVGATAIMVAAAFAANHPLRRPLAVIWNWLGILDLVVAVTCGFLSAPGPLQALALGQPNYLVGQYPLVLIPIFLVPFSILLHIASLLQLSEQRVSNHVSFDPASVPV